VATVATVSETPVYRPRSIRQRRTKSDLESLRAGLLEIAEANRPLTLRNLFYCAVSAGLVPKEERTYRAIMHQVVQLRRGGEMP
jgi:hypothetical protein